MISKKINRYKIIISIFFGVVGFVLNFYTVNTYFHPYKASFLIGLLFPMLITLSWGWKYGLLSALAGGCQSMWWLWGPSNGYAIFFVVPPFTLWIIWHGLFAVRRRKQKTHKWWLSIYAVEIPFRILSTINLYTLGRWAISLNPPPWSWASASANIIPLHFFRFAVVKQCVVGYIILLLADVLLNLGFIRRFFRLKEKDNQENTGYVISASLLLGAIFWVVDSVFDSLFFYPGIPFLDLLVMNVSIQALYKRTFFIFVCLAGGLLVSKLLYKQRESEKKLSQIVERISIPAFVINKKHIVTHWNKACENISGFSACEMVGTKKQWSPFYFTERPVMADVIVDGLTEEEIAGYYGDKFQKSVLIEGAYESEDFFPGAGGRWIFFTAAPLKNSRGEIIGAIETLQDITSRKQANKVLQTERDKSQHYFNVAGVMLIIIGADRKISKINKKGCEILGYNKEEELVGKSFFNTFIPERLREEVLKVFKLLMAGDVNPSEYYENPLVTKSGKERILLWHNTVLRDEQGKIYAVLCSGEDVTERRMVEKALQEAERLFRTIVETAPSILMITDRRGENKYVSPNCKDVSGYTQEELLEGIKWWVHEDDTEKARKMFECVFNEGKAGRNFEYKAVKKNGDVWYALSSWDLLTNVNGEFDGVIFQTIDVTERKQAEKELRESETKFRLLVEQIPASTYIASLDESSSTLYVSSRIETILGFSPEEYKKDPDFWVKHLYDKDRERVLGKVRHVHKTGQPFILEYRMISTDGRIVWIRDEAVIVKEDKGKPLYLLGIMTDITERKQAEDKLNQTVMDLKRSNEDLEQFAYVISHDLQEPLRMITSYVQLLAKRYKGRFDQNADDFIAYAVNGAKRMYVLINDLLIYSRLNRDSKPLEIIDSETILKQVLDNLKMVIKRNGTMITYDALPTVLMNLSQLTQVFQNLIENAVKFHGKEQPQIHISAKKEKNEWVFSVRDNGIGIDPEFFKRIFIIFQRLHTTEEYAGTGIGLALCKKIVEGYGGRIWIESEIGKGSVFYFTITAEGKKEAEIS